MSFIECEKNMKNFNKKLKKSNQTVNFDIDMLKDELIKPKQQFSNKDSKSKKRKRRK